MDRLEAIRQITEVTKAQKEKGDSITAACLALSIVANDIPYLLSEVDRLQAQLAESQRREQAAVGSWRGFCAKCDWNGRQRLSDGSLDARCKTCRENGKCNWQWRGSQAGKGGQA